MVGVAVVGAEMIALRSALIVFGAELVTTLDSSFAVSSSVECESVTYPSYRANIKNLMF